jgi:hypothetical protein
MPSKTMNKAGAERGKTPLSRKNDPKSESNDAPKMSTSEKGTKIIQRGNIPPLQAGARPPYMTAPAAAADVADFDAGKGRAVFVPHGTASVDKTASPGATSAPDGDDDVGQSAVEISPGKNLYGRDVEEFSVQGYSYAIIRDWKRLADASTQIARQCADAAERLTTAEKAELIATLPFEEATFSKFVRIWNDSRLRKPEVQRLLPPHYTTIYEITLLKDVELDRAIAEKIIVPDMTRGALLKWRRSRSLPKMKHGAAAKQRGSDSAAPITPTQTSIKSVVHTTPGQDENQLELPLEWPTTISAGGSVVRSVKVIQPADDPEAFAPSMTPTGEEGIPALRDHPLSADDQRVFDAVMAAFEAASPVVQERVRSKILRLNAI